MKHSRFKLASTILITILILNARNGHAQDAPAGDVAKGLNTYIRATFLQAAPNIIRLTPKTSILYRVVISVSEIYESIFAECVGFSGTEGDIVRLRYSIRLKPENFMGKKKPGYEGVHIRVKEWKNDHEVSCTVGNESYLISFDPDPSKINVQRMEDQ